MPSVPTEPTKPAKSTKSAKYNVILISPKKKDAVMEQLYSLGLYERKAVIHGTCVKFFTDNPTFKEMWGENFEPLPDWIRPHARVFAVSQHPSSKHFSSSVSSNQSRQHNLPVRVLYEPLSKTVIIEGCDYYGWVKSIALALVAEFLEDFTSEHRRYSIHGSFVDFGGQGIAIIGPPGSGKTTLTYGLLLDPRSNFLTDDWFFVRLAGHDTLIYSSEKNSYIRADLAKNWPQYGKLLRHIPKDCHDRAVVDVKHLLGSDRIVSESTLRVTVLLTRKFDKRLPAISKLDKKAAIAFLIEHDFCNPHQLTRSKEKMAKRMAFFSEFLSRAPVYLLNTVETPEQSLARLKKLI